MNETLNLKITESEIKSKTRTDILEEKVAKLEKVVFKEPTEMASLADEETRIIILGNIDRKLYAKVCELCLSEDDVNVIYEKGNKEEARTCFQNETKPIVVSEYLESTYGLSVRTANCLTRNFKQFNAPKAEIEKYLKTLLENDGERLVHVRNLGKTGVKEVMEKCR